MKQETWIGLAIILALLAGFYFHSRRADEAVDAYERAMEMERGVFP
jgi:hypothetical protein